MVRSEECEEVVTTYSYTYSFTMASKLTMKTSDLIMDYCHSIITCADCPKCNACPACPEPTTKIIRVRDTPSREDPMLNAEYMALIFVCIFLCAMIKYFDPLTYIKLKLWGQQDGPKYSVERTRLTEKFEHDVISLVGRTNQKRVHSFIIDYKNAMIKSMLCEFEQQRAKENADGNWGEWIKTNARLVWDVATWPIRSTIAAVLAVKDFVSWAIIAPLGFIFTTLQNLRAPFKRAPPVDVASEDEAQAAAADSKPVLAVLADLDEDPMDPDFVPPTPTMDNLSRSHSKERKRRGGGGGRVRRASSRTSTASAGDKELSIVIPTARASRNPSSTSSMESGLGTDYFKNARTQTDPIEEEEEIIPKVPMRDFGCGSLPIKTKEKEAQTDMPKNIVREESKVTVEKQERETRTTAVQTMPVPHPTPVPQPQQIVKPQIQTKDQDAQTDMPKTASREEVMPIVEQQEERERSVTPVRAVAVPQPVVYSWTRGQPKIEIIQNFLDIASKCVAAADTMMTQWLAIKFFCADVIEKKKPVTVELLRQMPKPPLMDDYEVFKTLVASGSGSS